MKNTLPAALCVTFAALFATPGYAGAPPTAETPLHKLLSRVESAGQDDQALFAEHREAYDAASPAKQQAMMERALAAREQAKAATAQVSDQYSENELTISNLANQLAQKASAAGLSAIFHVAQESADRFATRLQDALTNTQFSTAQDETGRLAFLRALAGENGTPTREDLQRLWYELQREITAQGQVVRYQAPVVRSNNKSVSSSVIRIGPFMATSEGRFLKYLPDTNSLVVLPPKLPHQFQSTLDDFQNTTQGYAAAVVDPSGGTLLGIYVDSPTWRERIELGGLVGYVIIATGLLGAFLFIIQFLRLLAIRFAVGRQLKNLDNPSNNNPLGRVLLAFKGDPDLIEEEADIAELRINEAVLHEEPKLKRFQAFLRLAVAAGPLLGLIGTVVGMIMTFQTITETGSADPRLMATGIGHAMMATVLGLGIAIPLLFGNALLISLSESVVQILDKQSNGMLAGRIEKQRGA